ncbi:HAMP domain-containing histidine kinase [Ideonella sp. 4Y16]|uniref:sensor histidine kinase n=1 Tax=Ideonella alba TaxID=2824118 RepID=UPI001B38D982|nr:HAMP domain-containing histidine kinase [Ideonella alba]MBQ0942432.1 HAMP domain-containing histidine kinase [Ideonella alba]
MSAQTAPAPPARLAALVVHDLKNELGALEARLQALAERLDDPGAAQARDDCRALRERFVQYLLVYGHDQGLRAHPSDEDPAELLDHLARSTARRHPGLQTEVLLPHAAPPFAFYDVRLVRLALEAALHNAVRFARGWIGLQAFRRGATLVFRIEDDGPGPGAPDPGAAHATGLGTALCEAVARAHGGPGAQVSLAPRPGGGARFELCLPA